MERNEGDATVTPIVEGEPVITKREHLQELKKLEDKITELTEKLKEHDLEKHSKQDALEQFHLELKQMTEEKERIMNLLQERDRKINSLESHLQK